MKEGDAWVEFAFQDMKMASLAMEEAIYNQVCFHSQQAVEKALKGYLESKGTLPPRTHKLIDIIKQIDLPFDEEVKSSIALLDRFYIPTRYPDTLPGSLPEGLPGKGEAKRAMATAGLVLETIKASRE